MRKWLWIALQIFVFVFVWWQIAPPFDRMSMQVVDLEPGEAEKLDKLMATALFLAALSTYAFATLCLYVPIWARWLLRRTARKN